MVTIKNPDDNLSNIKEKLSEQTGKFGKVAIVAGRSDCEIQDKSVEAILEDFRELINAAQEKTNRPNEVLISSIPPRNDCKKKQARIEKINSELMEIVQESGCTFVTMDDTFHLNDGSINTGFLSDGVKLTNQGATSIVKKLQLRIKHAHSSDVCKSPKIQVHHEQSSSGDNDTGSGDQWTTVTRKYGNRRYGPRQASNGYEQDRRGSSEIRCHYCSEQNHVVKNCRHGRPIICNSCGKKGHKSKFCTTA